MVKHSRIMLMAALALGACSRGPWRYEKVGQSGQFEGGASAGNDNGEARLVLGCLNGQRVKAWVTSRHRLLPANEAKESEITNAAYAFEDGTWHPIKGRLTPETLFFFYTDIAGGAWIPQDYDQDLVADIGRHKRLEIRVEGTAFRWAWDLEGVAPLPKRLEQDCA